MKLYLIILAIFLHISVYSRVIIIDQHGAGDFTKITDGITSSNIGDTVRVWPGTYMESILIDKNILVEGSGYENTIITGFYFNTVRITTGKMRWFKISSLKGNAVLLQGDGILANCVIKGAIRAGICGTGTSNACAINCIITESGYLGAVYSDTYTLNVVNCISRKNNQYGFYTYNNQYYLQISYSNGSLYNVAGRVGCFDSDPLFVDEANEDYHLQANSPCIDKGQPTINDPDGSRSDIGYFGGPDCPTFPVVFNLQSIKNGNNLNIKAKARANY